MAAPPVIDMGDWPGFQRRAIPGPAGPLSIRLGGPGIGPAVLLNHSILTSSAIWRRQASLLASQGFRVICLDMRGHGMSPASKGPYAMDDLVADNITVLDALGIDRVHYVGVSQGGMTGFGLGLHYSDRLASLCIIAARADAPATFAAGWDDRIALARSKGIDALAAPTAERWSSKAFLDEHPDLAENLLACIRQTSLDGFVGCAQAIQGLNYLDQLDRIETPTTLLIGTRDETLLQPMRDLAPLIAGAEFQTIEGAGHLPQLDQPERLERLLLSHLARVNAASG
jgi:3-oxoadipate enol-lactonase